MKTAECRVHEIHQFRVRLSHIGGRDDPPVWNILRLGGRSICQWICQCLPLKIIETIFPMDIRIQRLCRNQNQSLSPIDKNVRFSFMPTDFLASLTHEKL